MDPHILASAAAITSIPNGFASFPSVPNKNKTRTRPKFN